MIFDHILLVVDPNEILMKLFSSYDILKSWLNNGRSPYYNPSLRRNPELQNCQLYNLKLPKRDKNQPLTGS